MKPTHEPTHQHRHTKALLTAGLVVGYLLAGTAHAQSLADVAKQARAQRQASPPSAVYTNADLKTYPVPTLPQEASRAILDAVFADAYAAARTRPTGPRYYIDPYDKWWPFDGPTKIPERPAVETYVTYLGPPFGFLAPGWQTAPGRWQRDHSRDRHRERPGRASNGAHKPTLEIVTPHPQGAEAAARRSGVRRP